ncbi:MAG TPA: hypothetical protein VFY03_07565 [Woeseiaceae bacterium]|nr:hypothetical protein [Woeseiaceae bacterium]
MSRSLCRHDSSGLADHCAVILLALPVLLLAACGSDSNDDDDGGGGGTDTVAPTISAAVEPPANDAGWHNADVTVTFTCADTGSGIATCTDPVVVDTEGENQVVTGTATDQAGNTASTTVSINFDATAPALADFDPADGATVPQPGVNLTGTVTDSLSGTVSATCTDGGTSNEAVLNEGGSADERVFGCTLPLDAGAHAITVSAMDAAGNPGETVLDITHLPLPRIAIVAPENGSVAEANSVTVTGTIDDPGATVRVNGNPATVAAGEFTATVPVTYGINTLVVAAENAAGRTDTQVRLIAVFGVPRPPTVQLVSPLADFVLGGEAGGARSVDVTGWVRDNRASPDGAPPQVTVTVDEISPVSGAVIDTTVLPALVDNRAFGLCTTEDVCWRFQAESMLPADTPLRLRVTADATTGVESDAEVNNGVIDVCYANNGESNTAEACGASLVQRDGCAQSRRCIEASDGCPAEFGTTRNDPTGGEFGRVATAFGVVEDPGTAAGRSTVFGQERPSPLPCNRHDSCYSQWCPTEGATKSGIVAEKRACNLRFEQELLAVCRAAYPEFSCPEGRIGAENCEQWAEEKNLCFTWARLYADHVEEDADRYLVAGSHYDEWPYGGFLTMVEGCPVVP